MRNRKPVKVWYAIAMWLSRLFFFTDCFCFKFLYVQIEAILAPVKGKSVNQPSTGLCYDSTTCVANRNWFLFLLNLFLHPFHLNKYSAGSVLVRSNVIALLEPNVNMSVNLSRTSFIKRRYCA